MYLIRYLFDEKNNMKRKLLGFITCICLSLSLCTVTTTNVEAEARLSFAKTALWYI